MIIYCSYYGCPNEDCEKNIEKLIDNAPTVEIPTELCKGCRFLKDCETCEEKLRPQGEWKKHGLCFECPECHCGCMFTIVDKIVYGELNFCPNCGAKMKGGAE